MSGKPPHRQVCALFCEWLPAKHPSPLLFLMLLLVETLIVTGFLSSAARAHGTCAHDRGRFGMLEEELQSLQGQGRHPRYPTHVGEDPQPKPPVDPALIEAWHNFHDKEIADLIAHLQMPECALPTLTFPFDLVPGKCCMSWSDTGALDVNGFALNPMWKAEKDTGIPPNAATCGIKTWEPPCTSQHTYPDINDTKCPDIPPFYNRTGPLAGHANWWVATYTGPLSNLKASIWVPGQGSRDWLLDNDYQMDLKPEDGAGSNAGRSIELEFNSRETIDHFSSKWWTLLHKSVDDSDASGNAEIQNISAIAIGLVGLDCFHSCSPELHPVLGLAIHVRSDPSDDEWAIFVRNWGDEGYCSFGREIFPWLTSMSFILPMPGATSVAEAPGTEFYTNSGRAGRNHVQLASGGAAITFFLPSDSSRDDEVIHGDLHLRWTVSGPPVRQVDKQEWWPSNKAREFNVAANDEPESYFASLIYKMSPAQRALYYQLIPKTIVSRHVTPPCLTCAFVEPVRPKEQPVISGGSLVPDPQADEVERRQLKALRRALAHGPAHERD